MQTGFAYFCHTATVQKILKIAHELMLLPWEYQRAMGFIKALNPMVTDYTFFSHQWEARDHPFPDLKQLSEHIDAIQTPWFWCDWYCVPQWSRNPDPYPVDPLAVTIFLTTMKSFHRLCAQSTSAFAVVKRVTGLKMRGFDTERGWSIDDDLLAYAAKAEELSVKAKPHGERNVLRCASEMSTVGVDLEYGIRAWCALERCYLPAAPHKDC